MQSGELVWKGYESWESIERRMYKVTINDKAGTSEGTGKRVRKGVDHNWPLRI